MAEFTPELNKEVLDELMRRIREEEAQRIAAARGAATARGLGTGSTFEASLIGGANRAASEAGNQAALGLAVENASRLREERLERERSFTAHERAKSLADAQSRNELLGSGIGALGSVGGQILGGMFGKKGGTGVGGGGLKGLGGLFGGGGGFSMQTNPLTGALEKIPVGGPGGFMSRIGGVFGGGGFGGIGAGVPGGALGTLGLGALGIAAGSGAGQLLGKGLYKSATARKGARKGAQIGSVLLPGVGGVLGGALGGVLANPKKAVKNIGKSISKGFKKAFCFAADTLIDMGNGAFKRIKDVKVGDWTAGGQVMSIRESVTGDSGMYDYNGTRVTGSHAVKENGRWVRVADADLAVPVAPEATVFSLVTSRHQVVTADGTVFADEHETDMYEYLTIDESLDVLNGKMPARFGGVTVYGE